MNYFALLILFGALAMDKISGYPPGSCDGYTNLTDSWRNYGYYRNITHGFPNDDAKLVGSWWRFTGIGGNRIVDGCFPINHGGTKSNVYVPLTNYPQATLSTATTVQSSANLNGLCNALDMSIRIVLCPGSFYIYNPINHYAEDMGYTITHDSCQPEDCGPLALCNQYGGCHCIPGREFSRESPPTPEAFICVDIDECLDPDSYCGPFTNCINAIESFNCTCVDGFETTDPTLPPAIDNMCEDIDECSMPDPCGSSNVIICTNTPGSFNCTCEEGYALDPGALYVCKDIDECETPDLCGSANCINSVGSYLCECDPGFEPEDSLTEPGPTNNCIDIDECPNQDHTGLCGPIATCSNLPGSYSCVCDPGYEPTLPHLEPDPNNICIDINECLETPPRCGKGNPCLNAEGTFYCYCRELFYPTTGIIWEDGVTICKSVKELVAETPPFEEETKETSFLLAMYDQLMDNNIYLPLEKIGNCFAAAIEAAGTGPNVESDTLGSHGDGKTGSLILAIAELLVAASGSKSEEPITLLKTSTIEMSLFGIHSSWGGKSLSVSTSGQMMDIQLEALDYNGFAPGAFLNLKGLDRLLSPEYFETKNRTEMFGDVFTAILPMNTTNLTQPVNFTIYHEKEPAESGMLTCVFWEEKKTNVVENAEADDVMRWSMEGCWLSYSDENRSVCSCSHLSTFALIMQIGEPPPESDFLDWLNRVCVIVGLFFFALAVLTFFLCSWNPKINNTARLNLCLSLGLSHLLLLFNDRYLEDEVACIVMAGIIHFLVVASFVWMFLEAVQLYLLVRSLSKVQVIQKDGLPWPLLYLIGYGVPFVTVGVSALVYSDGYGPTEAGACWLSQTRGFNWALTGPVIAILVLNFLLFFATLWSLRPTLATMRSNVSQATDTRLIIFKIVAQFVILGCTWILGFYQTNIFFQVLFIVLNSQQGTFLYIVHCLLNKEVREEYMKWFSCLKIAHKEKRAMSEAQTVSEQIDKHAG